MMEPSNPAAPTGSDDNRDLALMRRIGQGDHAAFAELVEIHQHAVVGTVTKMLGNATEAEDVAQQVFVRVWRSAVRYQPSAKFTTWLFTITRNLVFNEIRRRQRKPAVSLDEREEQQAGSVAADGEMKPDESALLAELETAVDTAIQRLPEKQRMAVVLRRYQEMAYEDIGEILGLSLPAVKSLLFRARTQLREDLQKYLDG
ncbi:MAG: RNA polymerase sigma-70 factor, ECF subfamily [Verrucomicrobia bacterium]|nr:MAG: RNA polymerase sigma-70 factor, ECF subfamily [Verrucomicrobiota bacterium]